MNDRMVELMESLRTLVATFEELYNETKDDKLSQAEKEWRRNVRRPLAPYRASAQVLLRNMELALARQKSIDAQVRALQEEQKSVLSLLESTSVSANAWMVHAKDRLAEERAKLVIPEGSNG